MGSLPGNLYFEMHLTLPNVKPETIAVAMKHGLWLSMVDKEDIGSRYPVAKEPIVTKRLPGDLSLEEAEAQMMKAVCDFSLAQAPVVRYKLEATYRDFKRV